MIDVFGGRVFFVDATGGDDAKDGLSEANAWQTIGKVNGETFYPHDQILFKRGETWTGTQLSVQWSGRHLMPIVFGAYGDGALPIIDGNDAVHCAATIATVSWVRFENIDTRQGVGQGFIVNFQSAHIDIVDCLAHDCGNDGVLFINGCHHCTVWGGEFFDQFQSAAFRISGIEVTDSCYEVLIDGAECYDNLDNGVGVAIFSHDIPTALEPVNIVVRNCNIHDNAEFAILIARLDTNADRVGFNAIIGPGNTIDGTIEESGDVTVLFL